MTAIDATAVLGLAAKASQVFTEPGTYLGFRTIGPLTFRRPDLVAMSTAPFSADGERTLAQFSLLVNEIPDGPVWEPGGDRLWEAYGDVLTGAELADVPRTPEEEADHRRSYDVLYVTAADGTVAESPKVTAYEQYRDAYLTAAQEYNNRKGQAGLSTDPAVAEAWQRDEPELRERVDLASDEWSQAGHRAEVEEARRLLREFGSRSPHTAWASYLKQFNPDQPEIFYRTSVQDGSMYVPTTFLPADVFDAVWPTITVTGPELATLRESAPEALRSLLSGDSGPSPVLSLDFEYTMVTLSRPWFAPEVFASRAWRFYQPGRVLSDGGTPPSGECTSYVDGLVLVRNVRVERKASAASPAELGFIAVVQGVQPVPVRPYRRDRLMSRIAGRAAAAPSVASTRALRVMTGPPVRDRRRRDHRTGTPPVVRDHRGGGPVVRDHRAPTGRPQITVPVVPGRRASQPPPVKPPKPTRTATEAVTTVSSEPDEIFVLAFVCRLLPKSPDPDPALNWSA